MKILKALIGSVVLFASVAEAGSIACNGTITLVMADHPSCVDASGKYQLAFKLSAGPHWFCNDSDIASSMVLGAKFADKAITVYMSDEGGATCQVHNHYIRPSYTIVP